MVCSIEVGDQFGNADQGPHNSKVQYDKIMGYIEQGKKEGANLHLGGNAVQSDKQGYFIEVSCRDVRADYGSNMF